MPFRLKTITWSAKRWLSYGGRVQVPLVAPLAVAVAGCVARHPEQTIAALDETNPFAARHWVSLLLRIPHPSSRSFNELPPHRSVRTLLPALPLARSPPARADGDEDLGGAALTLT
jgi:hypothetical protein